MPLEFDGVNGIIKNTTSDGDVTIKGNDGGSEISALILDMSAEGGATFNNWLEIPDYIYHTADSNTYFGFNANDNFELFAGGIDRLSIVGSETVFNDGSADKDFRVESNGNTHMLFVDGGNNYVGIGTSSPSTALTVGDGSAQSRVRIVSPNNSSSVIDFADTDDDNVGNITYSHGDTEMIFRVADVDQHKFKAGEVVFNEASADVDFRVESDNDTHAFFIQGSNGSVGFGTSTMTTDFNVAGAAAFTTTGTTSNFKIISSDAGAATAPDLILYRNSSSPADNDFMGRLDFRGNDDAGNETDYISMYARATDVSNGSETSHFQIQDAQGTSLLELSTTSGTAEAVFNEDSANIDFRVESNGKTHMLFVDAGNDKVGIINSTPNDFETGYNDLVIGDTDTHHGLTIVAGTTHQSDIAFADGTSGDAKYRGFVVYAHQTDKMLFGTAGATQMRLHSNGTLDLGANSSSGGIFANFDRGGDYVIRAYNSNANPTGIFTYYSGGAPDSSGGNMFLRCQDTGAVRLDIRGDGDVLNHDNAFGSISDERIKQDIRDSNSQWDDIKAVKIRNYKKKDDIRQYGDNAWEQIGVVAQELETVSPKLIRHNDPSSADVLSDSSFGTLYEDGDDIPEGKEIGDVKEIKEQVKSVNYSILYMKAIKALQEAQTRIETLETKVAALEG